MTRWQMRKKDKTEKKSQYKDYRKNSYRSLRLTDKQKEKKRKWAETHEHMIQRNSYGQKKMLNRCL